MALNLKVYINSHKAFIPVHENGCTKMLHYCGMKLMARQAGEEAMLNFLFVFEF